MTYHQALVRTNDLRFECIIVGETEDEVKAQAKEQAKHGVLKPYGIIFKSVNANNSQHSQKQKNWWRS